MRVLTRRYRLKVLCTNVVMIARSAAEGGSMFVHECSRATGTAFAAAGGFAMGLLA